MTRLAIVLVALAAAGCGAAGAAEEPSTDPAPAAAADIPATAVVRCGPDGAVVETPEVAASRDGVHLEIRNESGSERAVHVRTADSAQGEGFAEGTHTRAWALPPGPATITCDDPAGGPDEQPGAPLEVVDPDGVWVSTALDCENVSTATLDYFAGAPGRRGDPPDVVRAESEAQLEPGDVVELAGYPDAQDSPVVRVVRDGCTIAAVTLMPTDDGGWLISTTSNCDEP